MTFDPDAEIQHDGPITPYQQLAGIIRARIARGDWASGQRIATEKDLVQEYGLARSTVRRAIAVLADAGDVYTVPQRGSYVTEKPGSDS